MKVLHIGKFYPFSGGIERVMFDSAEGLSHIVDRCDILCANVEDHVGMDIQINNSFCIYTTKSYAKLMGTVISPSIIFKLRSIMGNYDLIHIHHPDPMVALALFLSGFKKTVVLHWHSDIIKQKKALLLYSILQTWLLKRCAVIIATSPAYINGSFYLTKFRHKCVSIPIGVEPKRWEIDNIVRSIKAKYHGKKIIYSLGRLIYYKGFEYLIDSAMYLNDEYIILIGGGGPLYTTLKKQIESKKLEDKVFLLGRIPEEMMEKYYLACDLFCMSSVERTEAFGIAQIEAMSFGKPVVATNIPGSGVSWVNESGVSGLNVECRDSRGLANAFQQILSDSSLYHKLSIGALMRYKTHFTKEVMVNKISDLYTSLL